MFPREDVDSNPHSPLPGCMTLDFTEPCCPRFLDKVSVYGKGRIWDQNPHLLGSKALPDGVASCGRPQGEAGSLFSALTVPSSHVGVL